MIPSANIPQTDSVLIRAAVSTPTPTCEGLPIRTKRDITDPTRMPSEGADNIACPNIPWSNIP